jgi:Fe-S-cluster-containing hydrogenase component 2
MRRAIYWFSGTGNSLAAAKGLQQALEGAERFPMAAGRTRLEAPCDHLILVFPVYAGGLPAPVTAFINHLDQGAVRRATVVVTHGGMPGLAARMAAVLLADKGIDDVAAHTIRMVDNYPPLGGPPPPAVCRQREAAAATRVAELGRRLAAAPVPAARPPSRALRSLCLGLHALHRKAFRGRDQAFRTTNACTGCRICERICPVANIKLMEGRPVWQGHCCACFACYHACPAGAIRYGRRQKAARQYRHPAVVLDDLLDRILCIDNPLEALAKPPGRCAYRPM